MISIVILLLHFYFTCYTAFSYCHLTAAITDRILDNIAHTGLFKTFHTSKLIVLGSLTISLIGVRGRKTEAFSHKKALTYMATGLAVYFSSIYVFNLPAAYTTIAITYISLTVIGFLLFITGAAIITRVIKSKIATDLFNKENETFPQEERLIKNDYSINLPAQYKLKGKVRKSWINIINPFRGLLVMGSPGSGKCYFVIQHNKATYSKGASVCLFMILSTMI